MSAYTAPADLQPHPVTRTGNGSAFGDGRTVTTRACSRGSRSPQAVACRETAREVFQPSSRTMNTTLPSSRLAGDPHGDARDRCRGTRRRCPPRRAACPRPDDRVSVGDEDLASSSARSNDPRDEAVVERAQPLHRLALHRLGRDDLHRNPRSGSFSRRPCHQRARCRGGDEAATSSSSSRISSAVPL